MAVLWRGKDGKFKFEDPNKEPERKPKPFKASKKQKKRAEDLINKTKLIKASK